MWVMQNMGLFFHVIGPLMCQNIFVQCEGFFNGGFVEGWPERISDAWSYFISLSLTAASCSAETILFSFLSNQNSAVSQFTQ